MRSSREFGLLLFGSIVIACGGTADQDRQSEAGAEQAPRSLGGDPCSLVSQAEMEELIGPLGEPPYRVKDRRPDPAGDACMYRAKDLRTVTVQVDWEDGEQYFRTFAAVGGTVEGLLGTGDPAGDTLSGAWDDAVTPFGQFIAVKGRTSVHVDVLGSRLDQIGAAKVASIALRRKDAPLPYDGSVAARKHASPPVRDPCSLVTRAEVEAAMGPLEAAPEASDDKSTCSFGPPHNRVLEVQWADGFYALAFERKATGMASKVMRLDPSKGDPSLSTDVAGESEPWEERTTLIGGQIVVVKRDVLLKLIADRVGGFDENKALELLRIAARRL